MLGYQEICGKPLYYWRTNDFKHLILGAKQDDETPTLEIHY